MTSIRASHLKKSYWIDGIETSVINGIDLEVASQESLCIYGSSGAGKSTLLYLLACLEKPTNGDVLIGNENINLYSDAKHSKLRNQKMGFVFQFHHLLPDFSALENVMMPLLIAGYSNLEASQQAAELLSEVGLKHRLNHNPSQLSGGEQQRVAIARAIIHKPEIVFADEPTGNLDHQNGVKVFDLLLGLNRELRSTLIVVTHNESIIKNFNRSIQLVDGFIHEA